MLLLFCKLNWINQPINQKIDFFNGGTYTRCNKCACFVHTPPQPGGWGGVRAAAKILQPTWPCDLHPSSTVVKMSSVD